MKSLHPSPSAVTRISGLKTITQSTDDQQGQMTTKLMPLIKLNLFKSTVFPQGMETAIPLFFTLISFGDNILYCLFKQKQVKQKIIIDEEPGGPLLLFFYYFMLWNLFC